MLPTGNNICFSLKSFTPHLNCLRCKKKRFFKNGQKHRLNYINEQISDEIKRISSLITRRLFVFRNPKDTWNALKQLTGEQFSYNINDEISLDDLTPLSSMTTAHQN